MVYQFNSALSQNILIVSNKWLKSLFSIEKIINNLTLLIDNKEWFKNGQEESKKIHKNLIH
jgi:hypothetical protein